MSTLFLARSAAMSRKSICGKSLRLSLVPFPFIAICLGSWVPRPQAKASVWDGVTVCTHERLLRENLIAVAKDSAAVRQ